MARYFAGTTLAAFGRSSPSIVETTTAGRFDSTYVSSAITIANSLDYIETASFSASGTLWVRWDFHLDTNNNASSLQHWIHVLNGTTNIFRIVTGQPSYWNGSAWVNTGTPISTSSSNTSYTLKITLNSGFELYAGGMLVSSGSGWTGGPTSATVVRFMKWFANNSCNFSQIMVADYDLRDAHLKASVISGNSAANTGGTGTYTDINETVLDESTAEVVGTVGNRMGQTRTALSATGNLAIIAMVIAARGRVASPAADGKLGIRSGGTNYPSSGRGYNGGYEPRVYIQDTDPATAAAWTLSGFNAAETYLEAA